jgi:hypothetical protein
MNKAQRYRDNIQRSLREQWTHIEALVTSLPGDDDESLDYEELTKQDQAKVNNIMAIEAEWIVDPIQRAHLSVLQEEENS